MNLDKCKKLVLKIAEVGSKNANVPLIKDLLPFRHYFDNNGNIIKNQLSDNDGQWTRREILTRFLFLQAVLDQGPDIVGIRQLLKNVTNNLYQKEVCFLHKPLDFFEKIGISVYEILQNHEEIKVERSPTWADENKSTPGRYNLFMDDSKQVLGYAVYRWGVPLTVPYLLEKDNQQSSEPLVDFIESFDSSEIMSKKIKNHQRYGLGKAIGDKAAHLFAKWYVYTFKLCKNTGNSWNNNSFELPFDSNVGRVLFRTGYLFELATLSNYEEWKVIQKNEGKSGKHYIRVTNLREKPVKNISTNQFLEDYRDIAINYLKTKKSRSLTKIEIQQTFNVFLKDTDYGIGHLDDGMIHIGTTFCKNHDVPLCENCPINELCDGFNNQKELIDDYRT